MTYYLVYYIFSTSQRERGIPMNILDKDAPKVSGKQDTQRTTIGKSPPAPRQSRWPLRSYL